MREIQTKLLPAQIEFINSTEREVLLGGGFGSGKSVALAWKLFMRASKRQSREGLARKTVASLKRSTVKTLLEGDGNVPAVLPPELYTYNKQEGTINIKNGGQILLFSLDNPERVKSLNLTGCAVDEVTELTEAEYKMVNSRCRVSGMAHQLVGGNQLYSCCNPASPSHFLYSRFDIGKSGKLAADHREKIDRKYIASPTWDNFFLPQSYIDDLSSTTGVYRQRYFEGLWVTQDGLVYDRFTRDKYVFDVDPSTTKWQKVIAGVDFGFSHPTAVVVIALDFQGNIRVLDEWVSSGKINSEIAARARELEEQYNISDFVVDSAAPSLVAELQKAGLRAKTVKKDVAEGIRLVQSKFKVVDGIPGIAFGSNCKKLISELESYSWDDSNTDKPLKFQDDCVDALRYGITYLCAKKVIPRIHTIDQEPIKELTGKFSTFDEERCWRPYG